MCTGAGALGPQHLHRVPEEPGAGTVLCLLTLLLRFSWALEALELVTEEGRVRRPAASSRGARAEPPPGQQGWQLTQGPAPSHPSDWRAALPVAPLGLGKWE